MVLMERDYEIMQELERWRFCLGRHLKVLADFDGTRACDRRLKKLIEAGYIERKKVLYGVPSLYTLTYKGKTLLSKPVRKDKIKIEQITHDIGVLDTAIYFIKVKGIEASKIVTEKELHRADGFGVRKHHPDFVYEQDGKYHCVEVEITLKAVKRIEKNIEDNFMTYESQTWVIPKSELKIKNVTETSKEKYTDICTIEYEEVKRYVSGLHDSSV